MKKEIKDYSVIELKDLIREKLRKKEGKKKKSNFLDTFNRIFSMPIAAAMTGFGFFWLYMLLIRHIWFSMIVGLYISAIMSLILKSKNGN